MAYHRPKINSTKRFHAISRQYGHQHRCGPFTALGDMLAYLKVKNDAGDIFELHFCDWQFKEVKNDKTT